MILLQVIEKGEGKIEMKKLLRGLLTGILIIALCPLWIPYVDTSVDRGHAYAADADIGYKDALLSKDPGYYNNKLALVSAELCLATYTADGGKYSTDIDSMLLDMGCDYVSSEDYGKAQAFTVAEKQFTASSERGTDTVIFAVAQGSTIGEEFIKDATAWADKPCNGYNAYDYMYDFSNKIISKIKGMIRPGKKYKILVTGHSLGGAAANLVAARIENEIDIEKNDVYCYTFGAINSIASDKAIAKGYENIHNIYNRVDTFANDQYGFLMVTGAGGMYGKFGHMDMYKRDHRSTGRINHNMDFYRDDVRDGRIGTCKNYHNLAIAKVNSVTLKKTYTGKALTQKPRVIYNGRILKKGVDYKVTYKNNKNVGIAKMTIKGIGKYSGTAERLYEIRPKGTSIDKINASGSAVRISWKKQAAKMSKSRISGYQIQIATDSKFSNDERTVDVSGYSKTLTEIQDLVPKSKYYIRVRTYKTVSGVRHFSKWSSAKSFSTAGSEVYFKNVLSEFRFDYSEDGGAYDGMAGAIVNYKYNTHGLVSEVTGKMLWDTGKWQSYKANKIKYTYHANGAIKTLKVYVWNKKTPWISVTMNENCAVTKIVWGSGEYATATYGNPEYYPGTNKLSQLTLYDDENTNILYFNEEGYYIGTDFLDRDYAEVWVNEDGLREYYSFTGYMWADEESSEPTSRYTRDVTYEYTYSDGKVKTRKARETNYNEEDGYSDSFSIGVITARKWSRIKVNENTLRSARCAATVIKRVWDEGEMSLEVPGEFVYEWK